MRLAILLVLPAACTVFPAPDDAPGTVFEALWSDFDQHYGLFGVKPEVDWDAAYDDLRPGIDDDTTDAELSERIRDLLDPLDDDHVYFFDFLSDRFWTSWEAPREESFVDDDLRALLVEDLEMHDEFLSWGHLEPDVGYLRIHHFDGSGAPATLERAFATLADVDSLVIDIRDTPGGRDGIAAEIAGCFATESTPFLTIRLRNGPERDDFDDPIRYTVEPDPRCAWDRPAALLTDVFTVSAGEVFSLAMKDLPGVVHMGERTTGSFSDVIGRELPNGWLYGVSIGDWRDEDDVSYEGRGVVPEVDAVNTAERLAEDRDGALEVAVQTLRSASE